MLAGTGSSPVDVRACDGGSYLDDFASSAISAVKMLVCRSWVFNPGFLGVFRACGSARTRV